LHCGSHRFAARPHPPELLMIETTRRTFVSATVTIAALSWIPHAGAAEPIKIGLITALSGQSALGGEATSRGLQIAIDEINANGGLLDGRKLELVRRDDES